MVRYVISWQSPASRLLDVSVSFRAPAASPQLTLPVWRPGRYLIQNYAANVRDWTALDESGEPRRIWKDAKSAWRVDAAAGEQVTVTYRYYAGVLDAGSSFLDEAEVYVNGSNLLMMVDGLRGEESVLTIAAPADWRVETQLQREDANSFRARDYDHLIDSPVVAAPTMTRYTFIEAGARVHLIFFQDDGVETEQYVEPLRAVVRAQAAIFGGVPMPEYRFLVHIGDRWHGVEHEASCSIIAKRSAMLGAKSGDEGYDHFLSIASHELFHVWNVKRILPAPFAPYDYSAEVLTRLLWVMEGVTSYYGDLTLVRAGVWDEKRYLKHIAGEIETLESTPGREFVSLEQASFDGWLQNDVHDRANAVISFYNKGEVVAALLDLTIRQASGGSKSLDDVMRMLWAGGVPRPLSETGFREAVESVAPVGDFFSRYVEGTQPLPYAELFSAAGISMRVEARSAASLGATFRIENGRHIVAAVLRGGAGMAAGLLPGDELIGIDGTRTTSEAEVMQVIRSVDGPVEMLVARGGVIRTMTVSPAPDPRVRVTLEAGAESVLRREWLRRGND